MNNTLTRSDLNITSRSLSSFNATCRYVQLHDPGVFDSSYTREELYTHILLELQAHTKLEAKRGVPDDLSDPR